MDAIRLVLTILVVLVVLTGLVGGALALFQRHLIYPGAHGEGPRPAPDRAVAGASAVSLVTGDGERLFAFWRPPAPGCAVVVSFHGNASLPEAAAGRFLAEPWLSRGWGVLAPAYRGYPGSTGSPSEEGLAADAVAALSFVAQNAPGAPILLHGHSLGAAVAVTAAQGSRPVGLYLEAPFDSMLDLVRLRFPYLPSILLRDTWRSDERIVATTVPVLIVHGDQDPVVPFVLGRKLADVAGPRTRFVLLPGDHVSILGERDAEAEAQFRPLPCRDTKALSGE